MKLSVILAYINNNKYIDLLSVCKILDEAIESAEEIEDFRKQVDKEKYKKLMLEACRIGNKEAFMILHSYKVLNVPVKEELGDHYMTCLHNAAAHGKIEILKVLRDIIPIGNWIWESSFMMISYGGYTDILNLLLNEWKVIRPHKVGRNNELKNLIKNGISTSIQFYKDNFPVEYFEHKDIFRIAIKSKNVTMLLFVKLWFDKIITKDILNELLTEAIEVDLTIFELMIRWGANDVARVLENMISKGNIKEIKHLHERFSLKELELDIDKKFDFDASTSVEQQEEVAKLLKSWNQVHLEKYEKPKNVEEFINNHKEIIKQNMDMYIGKEVMEVDPDYLTIGNIIKWYKTL